MEQFRLSPSSTGSDLIPFALAFQAILNACPSQYEAKTTAAFKLKMAKKKLELYGADT